MAGKTLKLYRGISVENFSVLSPVQQKFRDETWRKILNYRVESEFEYPMELDKQILNLFQICRLEQQHFTDNKKIAVRYAKKSRGALVELTVPVEDLIKLFRLEFQNFGKRKTQFEIVYAVSCLNLTKNAKKWKMRNLKP